MKGCGMWRVISGMKWIRYRLYFTKLIDHLVFNGAGANLTGSVILVAGPNRPGLMNIIEYLGILNY
jgi:hypothetical protein